MITGVHAILFTRDADADRAFLRDVLELESALCEPRHPSPLTAGG